MPDVAAIEKQLQRDLVDNLRNLLQWVADVDGMLASATTAALSREFGIAAHKLTEARVVAATMTDLFNRLIDACVRGEITRRLPADGPDAAASEAENDLVVRAACESMVGTLDRSIRLELEAKNIQYLESGKRPWINAQALNELAAALRLWFKVNKMTVTPATPVLG